MLNLGMTRDAVRIDYTFHFDSLKMESMVAITFLSAFENVAKLA